MASPEPASQPAPAPEPAPQTAICLISQDDEKLVVHADAVRALAALGSAPIAPIAVAGLYRTGKSFRLTQLGLTAGRAADQKTEKTFVVGSTTESCTRGIWMWIAPGASATDSDLPA